MAGSAPEADALYQTELRARRLDVTSLFLTAVTEAELSFGLAIMPAGKRRDGLTAGLERMLRTGFANRVLPFDSGAARAHAGIAAARRRMVRPISQADGQITAIAHFRGMAVATRNIRDFEDTGIDPARRGCREAQVWPISGF